MELRDFTITIDQTFKEALTKIDANKKGFLVVLDSQNHKTMGTLTDGDIRRCIIKNFKVTDKVADGYKKEFVSLSVHDEFYEAIDLFKNTAIKFIPVLGDEGELINIITKSAMHALLLKDIYPDFTYDFLNVDGSLIDFEIFQRPWGFYKTTILNDLFQSKIISVKPGAALSLQLHHKREEHWVIVNGIGEVRIGDSIIDVKGGSYLFIPKGCKHRLTNKSEEDTLVLIEVQCGQYFGEDDIVRFEDDYGRA